MKRWIRPLTEEVVLRDFPVRGHTAGWFFRVNEVSMGVYKVEGTDSFGRTVSRTGTDPDELLAECEEDARGIQALGERSR
jgi:hypothetical protein